MHHSLQRYGWIVGFVIGLLAGLVSSQTPRWNYCRTADIVREILREKGVDLNSLKRGRFNKGKRQAQRELPIILFGGWGTGLYPRNGLVGEMRALHLMLRPIHPEIVPDPDHTTEYYDRLLFDLENPDSLASFLWEASYGQFRLTGDSYGWIPIDVPTATADAITFTPLIFAIPDGWKEMLDQAFQKLAPFVDFRRYDNDGDGRIDLLFVTVASDPDTRPPDGVPFADPTFVAFTIPWRFMWQLTGLPAPPITRTPDGIAVDCLIYVHEVFSVLPGHGAYAHEMGHAFGMPDLYNTVVVDQVDPGGWAVMATGDRYETPDKPLNPFHPSGFPVHHDPWNKFIWGWLQFIEVTGLVGTVVIPPYSERPVAYRLWAFGTPNSDEYFLIVNRQRRGFDRFLPNNGLNIFHIDRTILRDIAATLNNFIQFDAQHKAIDLVDADGRTDMDRAIPIAQPFDWTNFGFGGWAEGNWGDEGDPFPGSENNRIFNFLTRPSSVSYIGKDSGVRAFDIMPLGDGTIRVTLQVDVRPEALVLSPFERERVFTTRPTLQIRFTAFLDALPDIDPASITVLVDGEPLPLAEGSFDEGRKTFFVTLTDPRNPSLPLPVGTHTLEIQAKTRAGTELAPTRVTFSVDRFILRVPRDGIPLVMLSLPYDFTDAPPGHDSPAFVLGTTTPRIARWGVLNPLAKDYGYLLFGEFVERFVPGRAYWVRLDGDTILQIDAPDLDRTRPFRIANEPVWDLNELDIGWQQVGNPFPFPVDASAIHVVLLGGETLSLKQAIEQGVIGETVFGWTGRDYLPIPTRDWVMIPFEGYWVLKRQPCSLLILPKMTTTFPRSRRLAREETGALDLEVWGEGAEIPYRLRVRKEGHQVPAPPPAPGMTAWGAFLEEGRGTKAKEVALGKRRRWVVKVHSEKPLSLVTFRWKGDNELMRRYRFTLFDPKTLDRFPLGPSGEVQVMTDKEGKGVFVLVGQPRKAIPLRIVKVQVVRLRGRKALIRCTLTASAQVKAEVRTLTGRLLRVLKPTRTKGLTAQFLWDGRDRWGRPVPPSPVLLRLVAQDDEGQKSQRVVVFR